MKLRKKRVECASCKYVNEDLNVSDCKWTAFECGNSKSEYFRCLLNITYNGDKLHNIEWPGCESGKYSERRDVI